MTIWLLLCTICMSIDISLFFFNCLNLFCEWNVKNSVHLVDFCSSCQPLWVHMLDWPPATVLEFSWVRRHRVSYFYCRGCWNYFLVFTNTAGHVLAMLYTMLCCFDCVLTVLIEVDGLFQKNTSTVSELKTAVFFTKCCRFGRIFARLAFYLF